MGVAAINEVTSLLWAHPPPPQLSDRALTALEVRAFYHGDR